MIVVARFHAPEDAYLFRSFMASRGIGVTVLDEYIAQLFWQYRYASGGTRVVLDDPDDWAEAESAAVEYFESREGTTTTIPPMRGWLVVLFLSLLIGGPFPLFGRGKAAPQPGVGGV